MKKPFPNGDTPKPKGDGTMIALNLSKPNNKDKKMNLSRMEFKKGSGK